MKNYPAGAGWAVHQLHSSPLSRTLSYPDKSGFSSIRGLSFIFIVRRRTSNKSKFLCVEAALFVFHPSSSEDIVCRIYFPSLSSQSVMISGFEEEGKGIRSYLNARNWNLEKVKKMLEGTLEWRSNYKPQEIRWEEVAHEGETGKVSRANFVDRSGRPVLIMRPGKQNTKTGDGNVRHLVYLIENAILNLPQGQQQMTWMVDFTGYSINASNIQFKTSREIVHVSQNHYPERLALIVLYNPPKIFQPFFKVLSYFIDPKTYLKIKFVYPNDKASIEIMKSCFDTENLPSEFGGNANLNLNYDHEEFSKLMVEDDIKNAKFWDSESKHVDDDSNGHCVTTVTP